MLEFQPKDDIRGEQLGNYFSNYSEPRPTSPPPAITLRPGINPQRKPKQ